MFDFEPDIDTFYADFLGRPAPAAGWGAAVHVGEIPRLRAEKAPHDPCVADERVRLTSGEFAAAVERLSGGFASLGIGAGDVVATMLPNCVEMVLALFAAWRMGAAVTPVNPVLTAQFSRKWPR